MSKGCQGSNLEVLEIVLVSHVFIAWGGLGIHMGRSTGVLGVHGLARTIKRGICGRTAELEEDPK